MFIVKVHGGTTEQDIERVVSEANQRAVLSTTGAPIVLFLDEVNTTEAIGYVKQVLCDCRIGQQLLDGAPEDHLCVQPVQKAL